VVVIMQLPSRDGIVCDLCGLGCRHDFTYYSYDCRMVEVVANRKADLDSILRSTVIFSIDVCPVCFDKHKNTTISNYNKVLSPKRRIVIGTYCDLSGKLMVGGYVYYHVAVTKIEVRATIKPAQVKTDERYVEFNMSEDMYKELTSNVKTVRKVAGEWSASSGN
jgi:hypothetical protein